MAVNLGSDKTGNVRINVMLGRARVHCCSGTAVLCILSICLLPYLPSMQCACALLYFHLYPVWLLSHKRLDLKNKVIEQKMRVLIFSKTGV